MIRYTLIMFSIFTVGIVTCHSQSTASKEFLQLDGRVRVVGGTEDYVNVLALRDGIALDFTPKNVKKMDSRLQLRRTYVLSFQNFGYLTKDLLFDTYVPFEDMENAPFSFPFDVTLEPQHQDSTVRYAGPVGVIYYDKDQHDFAYIKDYTMIRDKPTRERVKRAMDQQVMLVEKMRTAWAQIEKEIKSVAVPKKLDSPLPLEEKSSVPQIVDSVDEAGIQGSKQNDDELLPMDTMLVEPIEINEPKAEALYRALERDIAEPIHVDPKDEPIGLVQRDLPPQPTPNTVYVDTRVEHKQSENPLPDGRIEELIQEKLRITLCVTITENGQTTRYKRVANAYGPVFYFEDDRSITQQQYQKATGRPN